MRKQMNGTINSSSRTMASVPNRNPHVVGTSSDALDGSPNSQVTKSGIPRSNAMLVLTRSPSRPGLTVSDDVQEQLFQRQRRMLDPHDLPAVPGNDRANLLLGFFAQPLGSELCHILHREQLIDAAQLLQLPLVQ